MNVSCTELSAHSDQHLITCLAVFLLSVRLIEYRHEMQVSANVSFKVAVIHPLRATLALELAAWYMA